MSKLDNPADPQPRRLTTAGALLGWSILAGICCGGVCGWGWLIDHIHI